MCQSCCFMRMNFGPKFTVLVFVTTFIRISVDSIPIDNGILGTVNQECLAGRSADLGFILDGSGSIGDVTFEQQKYFVNLVIDSLDVSPNQTRIGIVQFADWAQTELPLSHFPDKQNLKNVVRGMKYLSGATYTGKALEFARKNLFNEPRDGPVPKVAIVITDGQSQDGVMAQAEVLREEGVLVYAIGVTDDIDPNELNLITGSPKRVFKVATFDNLNKQLVSEITDEMCKTDFRPGYPEIICGSTEIGVRARTKNPFEGNVFIKHNFRNPVCRRGAQNFLANPTDVSITVPFTDCDINRYRSLNPRGVFVEATVIFMFHPFFMTKIDQAIRIQCFYMEADKTVDVPLEVSMLTTEFRSETYEMPTCVYSLHRGSPDGPQARFAVIGESLFHRWECTEPRNNRYDVYGMLVHSCYVDDTQGDIVFLVDEQGCGIDVHLLGTPTYSQNLKVAYRESHVFKYADRPFLHFQCQITLCYKEDGGCKFLTPPKCMRQRFENQRKSRSIQYDSGKTMDVLTESVTVFDIDINSLEFTEFLMHSKESIFTELASDNSSLEITCVGYSTLIITGLLLSLLYTVILIFVVVCVRRKESALR